MALLSLTRYQDLFHISCDEFIKKKESEDVLYEHVIHGLVLGDKQTLRKHLQRYPSQDLRNHLGEAGYSKQGKNIKKNNDLLDFIFGILFRVRHRRGEIEFCEPANSGSLLEALQQSRVVKQSRGLISLSKTQEPKISHSAITKLKKNEQLDLLRPYISKENKSKDELSDLLYGMLWLDDLSSDIAISIDENLELNGLDSEKTLQAFSIQSQCETTTGPHVQQTLSRRNSLPKDTARQLDFSTVDVEIKSMIFMSKEVMIGNAQPRCCPAVYTTNLQVCNKPCNIGAYCNRHRATHPPLLSSKERMLSDLMNQINNVLVCNGYEELIADDPEETFANVHKILTSTKPPWDDFSTDFKACSDTAMRTATMVKDTEIQEESSAQSPGEQARSMWYMVTANINGEHSNCAERSSLVENIFLNTDKSEKNLIILFLQEVNSKKIMNNLDQKIFYPSKKQSEILVPYELAHHPDLSSKSSDTCILYNSTIFEGTSVRDELRRLTKRAIAYQLRHQRAFDRLESRFSAVRLTSRRTSNLALLAVSFHGLKSPSKIKELGYDTADSAIEDLFERVSDYIRVHNIPAVVGGDFNKKPDSLRSITEVLSKNTGITLEVQSPKDNSIDFFVFCYSQNSDPALWSDSAAQMNFADLVSKNLQSEHHRKLFDHIPVEAPLCTADGFRSDGYQLEFPTTLSFQTE